MPSLALAATIAACEVTFPIHEALDAAAADTSTADTSVHDAHDAQASEDADATPMDGGGDASIDGAVGEAGAVWCGAIGDAATLCQGTCCVKIGNGYQFACRGLGDPCTGYNAAFSCDRSTSCPNSADYCCYTETGAIEAGTYFSESHCGSCSQLEAMCRLGVTDDCPGNTGCQPWFSNYGACR